MKNYKTLLLLFCSLPITGSSENKSRRPSVYTLEKIRTLHRLYVTYKEPYNQPKQTCCFFPDIPQKKPADTSEKTQLYPKIQRRPGGRATTERQMELLAMLEKLKIQKSDNVSTFPTTAISNPYSLQLTKVQSHKNKFEST